LAAGEINLRIHWIKNDLHFLDQLRYAVDEAIKWARQNNE
jgi:hypothetical protein